MWTQGGTGEQILMMACDTDGEATVLNEFMRVDKPLVAVLKHGPDYLHPHIEIRKESP